MHSLGKLSIIAILGALAVVPLPAQQVESGAIRRIVQGVVTDSASKQPIPGVTVASTETKLSTVTDSAGRYRLAGMLPVTVTLTFHRLGFNASTRRADLSRGSATIDLSMVQRAQTLEAVTVRVDSAAAFLRAQQATSTMTQDEVQDKRGQNLGETIKALPGVSIIQYGPSIAKPVVRGLHSQRIATVNAGVPQEGQQWGGEHAPEIDAFAANEIEVIRGPGTILYGSGAIGGVVKVMPRRLPTSGPMTGEFTTNLFSNNRQGAGSLLLEGSNLHAPLLGTLGWRTQVSARRAGDARTPDYYLPNTGFSELDYNAAVGTTRSWGTSELSYSHFGTDLGLYLGAHVGNLDDLNRAMLTPLTSPTFGYGVSVPNQRVSHDEIIWHANVGVTQTSRVEVSYGFQNNLRQEYDNHGFAAGGARPAFALQLYTHSLDVQYHHPDLGKLSGTIGFSGMRQGNLSPGRSFLIPQYRIYSGGLFGLEEFTWARLTLTGGARFDDRWQHAYQYGRPVVVSPDEVRNYAGASGSFAASFKLSDSWSIAGTASRAWRPPNVNERFSQGVHHGTAQYEIGDSSLVPERALNTDVTLRHLGSRTRLEISTYRNRIDDYVFLRPRDPIVTLRGTYPAYNYAQTDARLTGVEVSGQLEPASWLSLYANANIVRGVDHRLGEPLYDMPADRVTASTRLFAPSSSRFTSPFVELGTTLVRAQTRVPSVTIYKLPTAGYALFNAELGATAITIGRTRFEPSLAVRNLFDRRYRDYLSRYRLYVDETGRDVVLRLTMPFGPSPR